MKYRENILFLVFSLISISLGFISTYLISNYLTIEEYGKYQLLLTYVGSMTLFYFTGFDIIIQKQVFANNISVVYYVQRYIMPISLVVVILFMVVMIFQTSDYKLEYIVMASLITMFGMFDKTNALFNGKLKFKSLRYMELITRVIFLFLTAITVTLSIGYNKYVFIYFVLCIVVFILRIIYSKIIISSGPKTKVYDLSKKDIREGWITTGVTMLTILIGWSERLILGFIDPKLLAIFVIGQLFPKILKDNMKILFVPTSNTWAKKGFQYYSHKISKYQNNLIMFGIISMIVLMAGVQIIISVFFEKYYDSIVIAQILSLSMSFRILEIFKMSSITLSKHTHIANRINTVSNIFKIIYVSILIPIYGISGAAIGILLYEVTRFILVTYGYKQALANDKLKFI